jgi:hypothetical protein
LLLLVVVVALGQIFIIQFRVAAADWAGKTISQ